MTDPLMAKHVLDIHHLAEVYLLRDLCLHTHGKGQ
jgi:hypothetical protein